MGEHPDDAVAATSALTRLFVAAGRLGIDAAPLQARVPEVVPALGGGAWASLDSDDRLTIRCSQTERGPGSPIPRTAYARRFELEQGLDGHVAEIVTALGRRAYADDRALLLDAGVPDEVTAQIGELVDLLVTDGRCDALARRHDGRGETWIASVAFDAMEPSKDALELRAITQDTLVRLAQALGVHAAQIDVLEQMHWFAHHGFSVSFQFGATGVVPVLLLEYANIPWISVAKLAQKLRPVPAQAPRLGTFAGAFDAAHASSVQLAYAPTGVARMRVSVQAP